ncbi:MAG: glycogen/starch/alpha-glucan phosphorylase [Alphaproteobacteria bacterium]|nr:glycogen/starch/alpha-glucan phosphorylase [Alphaproteobacteria bacterium]
MFDFSGMDMRAPDAATHGEIRHALVSNIVTLLGRDPATATRRDWFYALAYYLRGRLSAARVETWRRNFESGVKWNYYLSMELLPGKLLRTCLTSQGLTESCREALAGCGVDLEELWAIEAEPALGNGGLGRLAACLLESMAALGFAGLGYCIRYEYGMFRQEIENGEQVEHPENWLKQINPWEFPRPDFTYPVSFNGRVTQVTNWKGELDVYWSETDTVNAMAYDMPVIGADAQTTGMMRLWSAKATSDFNFAWFNRGDYVEAVEEKAQSETLSRVLYPNDSISIGRELRLKQEFFLVSASLQDILHRHQRRGMEIERLADHVAIQLNDTHPVLAIAELMRQLVDVHRLGWDIAWEITTATFAFTNHTLLSEALELWPVPLMEKLLPRHLQIVYEINARFLRDVMHRNPGDNALLRRMSIIDEDGCKSVRMAHLAIVGSHRVNGVSHTHTAIMRQTLFRDFDRLWPDRIISLTNGISQRRWLADANPALQALIGSRLGAGWFQDFDRLRELEPYAQDAAFRSEFADVKSANKQRIARFLGERQGIVVDPSSLFDMHVKRIHEYKRQLLNLLQVIGRYNRIRAGADAVARTVIFAGKAAPGYVMAKRIIHLINRVADIVNNDPKTRDLLKIVFVPNYGVQVAELLVSAGDLSEQISTAGTEASGTGNMKLALNGALSIATEDGANTEIRDAVGHDNIWMFGHSFDELQALRRRGYDPVAIYRGNAEIRQSLDMIASGYFSHDERALFKPVVASLLEDGDPFMVLADYDAYVVAQASVDEAWREREIWTTKAILNVSRMSPFSMDRLVRQYAQSVWNATPVPPAA